MQWKPEFINFLKIVKAVQNMFVLKEVNKTKCFQDILFRNTPLEVFELDPGLHLSLGYILQRSE